MSDSAPVVSSPHVRGIRSAPPTIAREGRGFSLRAEVLIPRPLSDVFPFFADARNLEKLTPSYLNFEIRTPGPIEMRVGTLIDYRIRLHGIPLYWKTRIDAWEPPHRFVDTQLSGPYQYWVHEHLFQENAEGTLVLDYVQYKPKLSWLTHRWFVRPDIVRIFAFRTQSLCRQFGIPMDT